MRIYAQLSKWVVSDGEQMGHTCSVVVFLSQRRCTDGSYVRYGLGADACPRQCDKCMPFQPFSAASVEHSGGVLALGSQALGDLTWQRVHIRPVAAFRRSRADTGSAHTSIGTYYGICSLQECTRLTNLEEEAAPETTMRI